MGQISMNASIFDCRPVGPTVLRQTTSGDLQSIRHQGGNFFVDHGAELGLVIVLSHKHLTTWQADGKKLRAPGKIGHVTVMPPGTPTRVIIEGPCTALRLRISWERVTRWLAEDSDIPPERVIFRPTGLSEAPRLARLLLQAMAADPGEEEVALRAVTLEMFATYSTNAFDAQSEPMRRGGLAPAKLRRVEDMIQADPQNTVSVADLASEIGISPFHFARKFKRVTGETPYHYILRHRVIRALDMLQDRAMSVESVALRAGFRHGSHLARHMRRMTGLTPSSYRGEVLP